MPPKLLIEGKTKLRWYLQSQQLPVSSVSAGRLVFWRRVKIFGKAVWGPMFWIWRSFCSLVSQRLVHKGSFHKNCIEG